MPPRSRAKVFSITFKSGWKKPAKKAIWWDFVDDGVSEEHILPQTGPIRRDSDQIWQYLRPGTAKLPRRLVKSSKILLHKKRPDQHFCVGTSRMLVTMWSSHNYIMYSGEQGIFYRPHRGILLFKYTGTHYITTLVHSNTCSTSKYFAVSAIAPSTTDCVAHTWQTINSTFLITAFNPQ